MLLKLKIQKFLYGIQVSEKNKPDNDETGYKAVVVYFIHQFRPVYVFITCFCLDLSR